MVIKNFYKFIKDDYPSICIENILKFNGKCAAIDTSEYINKSIKYFIKLLTLLQNNNIKCLFVYTDNNMCIQKELLNILDIAYIDSLYDIQTTCSDLCIRNIVDFVISNNTDIVAYGTPKLVTNLNIKSGSCKTIKYNDVLKNLDMTSEIFLNFCIMCGTSYNSNIPRIGTKRSYKLIKKYKTIANTSDKTNINIDILNHLDTINLFRNYTKRNIDIQYFMRESIPDKHKYLLFITNYNI